MKIINLCVIVSLILLSLSQANAKVNPHAIGLRLGGDGDDNDVEISYQHGLSKENRLEFDLGFGGNKYHNRTFLAGIYHWNWNIDGGFNWYVGPGAVIGLYSYKDNDKKDRDYDDDGINISIGGQIGIEYDFNRKAPILLSLDLRPMWGFVGDNSGIGWGLAFGVRYTW